MEYKIKNNQDLKQKNEPNPGKNNNRIDCGKLGVGLIGTCLLAPCIFPTIGTVQTALLIPMISKGLVTIGATALSGITAYSAFDLFFNNISEKDVTKETDNKNYNNNEVNKDVNQDVNQERKEGYVTC